jgi:PAS domain S-box-containing protein
VVSDDAEDEELRAVALKNAESILNARRRAERDLLAANEALERKTQELLEQREWFEVSLSSIGDAVITTDVEGKVTFLNPVAERMTACGLAQAVGLPLEHVFQLINEQTREPAPNPVRAVLRDGNVVRLANHTALISKDGKETPIDDSAAPIRNASGRVLGAVMVFHDVTVRHHAEAALRETDRRKDEFLATLAHELRNPLAPIRQAALISNMPTATEAQKRWSHDVITRQVQQMSLLLDDLLDVSRITRGTLQLRKQATELSAVIEAGVETARPTLDAKRHRLSLDIPPERIYLSVDPLRIAQVLSNLLTNAAKYTDPEGMIRVVARPTSDSVMIHVIDNGIGIAQGALPGIFEMFSQITSTQDRSDGGLGIGLALAKGLVELHGGRIDVKSRGLGQGSEFTVRLPIGILGAARRPKPEGLLDESAAVSRRILLADDNQDSAESLAMLLRMEGHEVVVVHDGPEALAAVPGFNPGFILLDIGMPGLNGYEVARKIRTVDPATPIKLIAVTGWGQHSDKARARAAGFDHHFTKPVEPDPLIELLRRPIL